MGLRKIFLIFGFMMLSTTAFGWGPRGHDSTVTIAAQIVQKRYPPELAAGLLPKATLLAHLANIPDAHWKGLPKPKTTTMNPTHWLDLDLVSDNPKLKNFPFDLQDMITMTLAHCSKTGLSDKFDCQIASVNTDRLLQLVGSAPWRAAQFTELMVDSFKAAKQAQIQKRPRKEFESHINQALLYGGLLGHFIADLALPIHVVKDSDGWAANQGGLHAYFETDIINQFDFELEAESLALALAQPAHKRILSALRQHRRIASLDEWQPVAWATALAFDSFERRQELFERDRKYAVMQASSQKSLKDKDNRKAIRKPARETADHFKALAIERIAAGADLLALFWYRAWERAGKPDLTGFRSYKFHFRPKPILPDYIPATTRPQASEASR